MRKILGSRNILRLLLGATTISFVTILVLACGGTHDSNSGGTGGDGGGGGGTGGVTQTTPQLASCPTTTANVFTQNEKFISNVPSTYTVNQVTPSNITVRFGFTVPAPTAANATPTISDTTEDITTTGTVTFSNAVFDPGSTSVRRWNEIAMNANAIDHTFWWESDQLGPARTSRAFAIVHIAIFDAVNAIAGGYQGYTRLKPAHAGTSMDAAIAQAAHDTLVALFPSQKAGFDGWLAEDLGNIPNGSPKAHGIALGKRAAKAILELRNADGSQVPDPPVCTDGSTVDCFQTSAAPGKWRQDPISKFPLALGAYWGGVKPFVMQTAYQFRVQAPPALDSQDYAVAFEEVKSLGGCGSPTPTGLTPKQTCESSGALNGVVTPTERFPEQTQIGIYWGYDGTPGLGAPPRLFNQIAVKLADQMGSNAVELARLLALVNVAMADAAIATWESKYYYQFWRPITGIRDADDLNSWTVGDSDWTPLGAQASNLYGPNFFPNFTPPFPACPSGHAGFAGAVFQTLRHFYGTDNIAFTFVSDELNGVTRDNTGNMRPVVSRRFSSLSQAEEEVGQSRIYLGIHWAFDKTEGIAQGRSVADWVFEHAFVAR